MATIQITTGYGSYTFPQGQWRLGDDILAIQQQVVPSVILPRSYRTKLVGGPKGRTIRIEGFIVGTSVDDCWSKRNSLMKALPLGITGTLRYTQGSSVWEIDVLVTNVIIQDRQGGYLLQAQVVLQALESYWREVDNRQVFSRAAPDYIDTVHADKRVYGLVVNNPGTAPTPVEVRLRNENASTSATWTNPEITVYRKNLIEDASFKNTVFGSVWIVTTSNSSATTSFYSPSAGIDGTGAVVIGNKSLGASSDWTNLRQFVYTGWLGTSYVCFSAYVRLYEGSEAKVRLQIAFRGPNEETVYSTANSTLVTLSDKSTWVRLSYTTDLNKISGVDYLDHIYAVVHKEDFTSVGMVAVDKVQVEFVADGSSGPTDFCDTNEPEYQPVVWKRVDPLTGSGSSATIATYSEYIVDFATGASYNGGANDTNNTTGTIALVPPGYSFIKVGGTMDPSAGGSVLLHASLIPRNA